MTDAIKKLLIYKKNIEDKQASSLPEKHKHREVSYKNFLKNELEMVNKKIERLKGL